MLNAENAELFKRAAAIVREAGNLLSDRSMAAQVREKGKTDFVTAVDTEVQEYIFSQLQKLDRTIQFMGEEQDNSLIDLLKPTWILDPVDGTTNLIHGFCHSAVSLALAEKGQPVFGIVFNPFAEEMFTASLGGGAYCNERNIHVSSASRLSDSLCSVGTNPGCRGDANLAFRRMRAVYDCCHDIRRIGTAAVELCYVAAGRLDAYLEHGLKAWDYAAGKLIVEEAGGRVTAFDGSEAAAGMGRCDILATNGYIHGELLSLL